MSGRVRVWCLRHGESQNVLDAVAGAVPSAPLTERGHEQAALAARTLAGEPIAAVYSSAAVRARQTAQPLATAAGVEIRALSDLVEAGVGRHDGSNDPGIRREAADVLRAWAVDNDLARQVADGESGFVVAARMGRVFQAIASQHAGETVAVVGHVASLTVAIGQLCAPEAVVWGTPLPHAIPFLLEWDGSGWRCPAWPEAA